MLVIGVAGTELTAQERDWLQHDACAGVILFSRNFASRAQVTELSAAIRARNAGSTGTARVRLAWCASPRSQPKRSESA